MNKFRLICAQTLGRPWMRYIFVLVYWVLTYGAHAQTYPVQVTTTLIPPYSPVLSYYTAADANNLQVIIHVMELDRHDLRAKLRVTIEGAGVRLYTSPAYVPPALVLQGGVPEMLSGFDIRGYLNPNNLIFEGITRAEFIKSGKLPEGFYTFTIEVLEYNRSVRISNQSRANAWVVLNDPPLINFPFSGDKLRTTDPQNISFSWVGRHLASPNSAFSTEYEFTLYELYPGQTNPEVAVRSSNSIYRTTTTQSSLYYGPAEPQLIPGKKYAYRIRAYDVSGRDLFKNQGYSETNWFQYGDACLPLRSVTAEALDPYRIRISWEPEATHTGFVVSYREADTDTWWKETTYSTSLVIPDLKKGTSYEYQVMGQCNQYEGETSTIQTISTEAEETEDPNFACGTDLIMPELSPNPLQKPLLPLDLFHIGGLDVVVHTVTLNANGSYSGMGHAPMPIFNGAGMRVKIRNVIINEDYYAIAGSVVTVYDTEGRFIVGNTDDLKGDLSEEDAAEDTTITDAPDDNLLAVEGEIGHVEVIAGELVVTDAEGNPMDIGTVELPAEGETLTLEDASGDTWVVDSEGNVTPGAGNGSTGPNTPGAVGSDVELDYIVTFSPSENQTYGFDEKTQSTLSGYNQTQLNGQNHWIAWKSVESGHTDYVQVAAEDQDEFPDYLGFKTSTGTIPSQSGKDKNTRELTLSGILAGNPTTLTAYATQEDEEGNATEVTLGRLDVVAYDMERQKVVIVPVNDAQTPDASALYESLNKIYAQAVAHWEVVVDHAYSVEPEVLQTLDEGESGLLSSFPKNMKQFQQDFKKSRDLDKDAYYLFLIPGSGARAGFMPFKRQYGYIWTGATSDVSRTIAHELAHGAFRLRHTFSPEAFIATQGSTNNLMDYSSAGAASAAATHLYKHQWDNVHNPESVTSWLQDDEEGAMEAAFPTYCIPDATQVTKLSAPGELQSYLMPSGVPIRFLGSDLLKDVTFGGFTCDGESSSRISSVLDQTLSGFTANGNRYVAVLELELIGDNDFIGYVKLNEGEKFDEDKIDDYSYYYFESNVWDKNITLYLPGGAECTTIREDIDFEKTELIESLPCEMSGFEEIRLANLANLEQDLSIKVMDAVEYFWQGGRRYYLNEESQTANDYWITQLWNDLYGPYYSVDDEGFIEMNTYNLPAQQAFVVQVGQATKALKDVGTLVRSLAVLMAIIDADLNLSAGQDDSDILDEASTSGETDQLEIIAKVIKLREDVIDILRNETLNEQTLREFIHLLYQTNEALKRVFSENSEFPFHLIDYESLQVKPLEENIIEPTIDEKTEEVSVLFNDPDLEQLITYIESPDFDPERYTKENDEEEDHSAYVSVREIKYLRSIAGVTQPLFYVGITTEEDPIERYKNETTSTLVGNALNFEIVDQDLDKSTARGIEQVLILLNNNGSSLPAQSKTVDNQRNSTAPSRDVYMYRLIRGYLHLETLRVDWKTYYKRNAKYVENKLRSENQWLENIYIPQK